MLSTTKEIVTITATVIGVIIACLGLRTWKEQLKGTTKYKVAKDVLFKTFRLRDTLKHTRTPYMARTTKKSVFETYNKRLDRLNRIKQKLEISKLEAEVVFGEEETKEIKDLIKKVNALHGSFILLQGIEQNDDPSKNEIEITKELRKDLYGRFDEKDMFHQEITNLTSKIKERFKKHLK